MRPTGAGLVPCEGALHILRPQPRGYQLRERLLQSDPADTCDARFTYAYALAKPRTRPGWTPRGALRQESPPVRAGPTTPGCSWPAWHLPKACRMEEAQGLRAHLQDIPRGRRHAAAPDLSCRTASLPACTWRAPLTAPTLIIAVSEGASCCCRRARTAPVARLGRLGLPRRWPGCNPAAPPAGGAEMRQEGCRASERARGAYPRCKRLAGARPWATSLTRVCRALLAVRENPPRLWTPR